MANPADIRSRVAVAEQRLEGQGAEIQRLRERIHLIEGDRAAIRMAVSSLRELRDDMPTLASTSAERAVETVLERRDELRREEGAYRRSGIGLRLQFVSVGVGAAGFLFALLALFFH